MVNKYNQIVCNLTKIILNDGVTVYPGYIEVEDGKVMMWNDNDPNNALLRSGILKHRIKYAIKKQIGKVDKNLDGMHFLCKEALLKLVNVMGLTYQE